MKTTLKIMAGLGMMMALLTGCVVSSVYPFYTPRDLVFDPALVGAWAETGSTNAANEQWRFDKAPGTAYTLTIQDKEKRTEFDAHLFKLKGRLFLDLCSRERPDYSLPLHYLIKVSRIEAALEMNMLDYDWLKKVIGKDAKAISHIVVPKKLGEDGDGDLILTAATAELQRFILKHERTAGAFGDSFALERSRD